MPDIDLDAYLQRIGYQGVIEPTLPVLNALICRHANTIPFENLNSFIGLPVSLNATDVERKLVRHGRGGYCFEQNFLLWRVLERVGYVVTALAARVTWGQTDNTVTPRGHMALKIDLPQGSHLVDVGFGGTTPTSALHMIHAREHTTPHETMRLLQLGDEWRLQVKVNNEWIEQYRFDLQRQHPVDYVAANYYTATHPDSAFVRTLKAARATENGRHTLLNRALSHHRQDGSTQKRTLNSTDEVLAVLTDVFLIRLPDEDKLRARIDTLA